jgi:hypothetical protein
MGTQKNRVVSRDRVSAPLFKTYPDGSKIEDRRQTRLRIEGPEGANGPDKRSNTRFDGCRCYANLWWHLGSAAQHVRQLPKT